MTSAPRRPCIKIPSHHDFASNAAYYKLSTAPTSLKTYASSASLSAPSQLHDVRLSFCPSDYPTSRQTIRLSPPRQQRAYHREPYPLSPSTSAADISSVDTLTPPVSSTLKSSPCVTQPLSKAFWLALYFCFNLGLTLYNKGVLLSFPFPYTLTAIHALFGTLGGTALLRNGSFTVPELSLPEKLAILAFSALYSINILVSNASLGLVTIPFHQVVRAATPVFTIMFSSFLFKNHSSYAKRISLIPVVFGVGFATYGDYYYTVWGLILTLFGTVLAALKTIFTHLLQSRKTPDSPSWRPQLPSLTLLYLLSPLAFIQCVVLAWCTGELSDVQHYAAREMTVGKASALAVNGCIAFGLNIVSFTANKQVGALGMTVAANIKQVLTILFAVSIFDLSISFTNAVGIVLTLIGGAWYARVELNEARLR